MKTIEVTKKNNQITVTVETGFWIFKRTTTYQSTGNSLPNFCGHDYYDWVKMPNNIKVYGSMSFQLDAWADLLLTGE